MLFIARLTHNSPPVPATTMKKKRTTWSILNRSRRSRRGSADDQYSQADHGDACPAQERDDFAQDQITQNRDGCVGQSRRGLNVAVIGPSQQKHVHDKESEEAGDSEPQPR